MLPMCVPEAPAPVLRFNLDRRALSLLFAMDDERDPRRYG